jgi:hypothetical protein
MVALELSHPSQEVPFIVLAVEAVAQTLHLETSVVKAEVVREG